MDAFLVAELEDTLRNISLVRCAETLARIA
jgi:hypothetical protein